MSTRQGTGSAGVAPVEAGEGVGAVAEHGHRRRLQHLERRGHVEDRLHPGADDEHADAGERAEVGGDVPGLPGAAVHPAEPAGGEERRCPRHGPARPSPPPSSPRRGPARPRRRGRARTAWPARPRTPGPARPPTARPSARRRARRRWRARHPAPGRRPRSRRRPARLRGAGRPWARIVLSSATTAPPVPQRGADLGLTARDRYRHVRHDDPPGTMVRHGHPGAARCRDPARGQRHHGHDEPKMFHYVLKNKIAESAVLGNLVQALCGETFPVTRAPKPGSPVCPDCKRIYERLKRRLSQRGRPPGLALRPARRRDDERLVSRGAHPARRAAPGCSMSASARARRWSAAPTWCASASCPIVGHRRRRRLPRPLRTRRAPRRARRASNRVLESVYDHAGGPYDAAYFSASLMLLPDPAAAVRQRRGAAAARRRGVRHPDLPAAALPAGRARQAADPAPHHDRVRPRDLRGRLPGVPRRRGGGADRAAHDARHAAPRAPARRRRRCPNPRSSRVERVSTA